MQVFLSCLCYKSELWKTPSLFFGLFTIAPFASFACVKRIKPWPNRRWCTLILCTLHMFKALKVFLKTLVEKNVSFNVSYALSNIQPAHFPSLMGDIWEWKRFSFVVPSLIRSENRSRLVDMEETRVKSKSPRKIQRFSEPIIHFKFHY